MVVEAMTSGASWEGVRTWLALSLSYSALETDVTRGLDEKV